MNKKFQVRKDHRQVSNLWIESLDQYWLNINCRDHFENQKISYSQGQITILFWISSIYCFVGFLNFLDNILRESRPNLVRVANRPKLGGRTLLPMRLHTTCIYLPWSGPPNLRLPKRWPMIKVNNFSPRAMELCQNYLTMSTLFWQSLVKRT